MRRYIEDNENYYELDEESQIKYPRDIENIYFWKWFDDECKLVYKEFVMKDLIILNEDEVPKELKPRPYDELGMVGTNIISNFFVKLKNLLIRG